MPSAQAFHLYHYPEVRDAVLVLGEIKAALERLNSTFELEEEPL